MQKISVDYEELKKAFESQKCPKDDKIQALRSTGEPFLFRPRINENTNNVHFFSSSFGERELAAARGEGNDHEGEQVQPGFLGGKDTKVKSLESEDGMMVDQAGSGGPGAARSLGSRGSRQGSARSQAAEEGRGGADHFFPHLF